MTALPLRRFFLAIRHKPSGGFLPEVRGYGFTRTSPSMVEPPRLFVRKSSATQALQYWLLGEHYDGWDDNDFGGERQIKVRAVPSRRACDMEIVELELVVRSLSEAQLRIL